MAHFFLDADVVLQNIPELQSYLTEQPYTKIGVSAAGNLKYGTGIPGDHVFVIPQEEIPHKFLFALRSLHEGSPVSADDPADETQSLEFFNNDLIMIDPAISKYIGYDKLGGYCEPVEPHYVRFLYQTKKKKRYHWTNKLEQNAEFYQKLLDLRLYLEEHHATASDYAKAVKKYRDNVRSMMLQTDGKPGPLWTDYGTITLSLTDNIISYAWHDNLTPSSSITLGSCDIMADGIGSIATAEALREKVQDALLENGSKIKTAHNRNAKAKTLKKLQDEFLAYVRKQLAKQIYNIARCEYRKPCFIVSLSGTKKAQQPAADSLGNDTIQSPEVDIPEYINGIPLQEVKDSDNFKSYTIAANDKTRFFQQAYAQLYEKLSSTRWAVKNVPDHYANAKAVRSLSFIACSALNKSVIDFDLMACSWLNGHPKSIPPAKNCSYDIKFNTMCASTRYALSCVDKDGKVSVTILPDGAALKKEVALARYKTVSQEALSAIEGNGLKVSDSSGSGILYGKTKTSVSNDEFTVDFTWDMPSYKNGIPAWRKAFSSHLKSVLALLEKKKKEKFEALKREVAPWMDSFLARDIAKFIKTNERYITANAAVSALRGLKGNFGGQITYTDACGAYTHISSDEVMSMINQMLRKDVFYTKTLKGTYGNFDILRTTDTVDKLLSFPFSNYNVEALMKSATSSPVTNDRKADLIFAEIKKKQRMNQEDVSSVSEGKPEKTGIPSSGKNEEVDAVKVKVNEKEAGRQLIPQEYLLLLNLCYAPGFVCRRWEEYIEILRTAPSEVKKFFKSAKSIEENVLKHKVLVAATK